MISQEHSKATMFKPIAPDKDMRALNWLTEFCHNFAHKVPRKSGLKFWSL